jgi:hypothetical protein
VRQHLAPEKLFVADEQGLPLTEASEAAPVAACAPLLRCLDEARSLLEIDNEGLCSISLGSDRSLHLAETRSRLGRFALGVVARKPIDPRTLRTIQAQFERVFSPEGGDDDRESSRSDG